MTSSLQGEKSDFSVFEKFKEPGVAVTNMIFVSSKFVKLFGKVAQLCKGFGTDGLGL